MSLQSHNLTPLGSWIPPLLPPLMPVMKIIVSGKLCQDTWIVHDHFCWNYKLVDLLEAGCWLWRSVWAIVCLKLAFIFVIQFSFTALFLLQRCHEPQPGRQGDQPAPASHRDIPKASQSPWHLLLSTPPQGRTCLPGQPGLPLALQTVSLFLLTTSVGWASCRNTSWCKTVLCIRDKWNPQVSRFLMSSWKLN